VLLANWNAALAELGPVSSPTKGRWRGRPTARRSRRVTWSRSHGATSRSGCRRGTGTATTPAGPVTRSSSGTPSGCESGGRQRPQRWIARCTAGTTWSP
jgi:hypothetical protein